jgi:thioredoxin 1
MRVTRFTMIIALILPILFLVVADSPAVSADLKDIPVKGMVTMVDLGAKKCVPCKMMAPILERLEKRYAGRPEACTAFRYSRHSDADLF